MERGAAIVPVRSIRSLRQALALPDALRWHAAAFAGGAVALTLLNVMRSPDRLWFWAPLLAWCALLAAHGWFIARAHHEPTAANVTVGAAAPTVTATSTVPNSVASMAAPAEPSPAHAAMPPARLPAAAELAALRLSLDPWATAALASANAGREELPESVLALWRLEPDPLVSVAPEATSPARPAVDLRALSWI